MSVLQLLLVGVAVALVFDVVYGQEDETPHEGQVKLAGGQINGTGNVLVWHDGDWGAICDDGWNLAAAHVICKTLGYAYALGHTTQAYFGRPEHDIVLDDIRCYGDELSLLDCRHSGWYSHNCDSREAAGVFCAPGGIIFPSTRKTTTAPPETTTIQYGRFNHRRRPIFSFDRLRSQNTNAVNERQGAVHSAVNPISGSDTTRDGATGNNVVTPSRHTERTVLTQTHVDADTHVPHIAITQENAHRSTQRNSHQQQQQQQSSTGTHRTSTNVHTTRHHTHAQENINGPTEANAFRGGTEAETMMNRNGNEIPLNTDVVVQTPMEQVVITPPPDRELQDYKASPEQIKQLQQDAARAASFHPSHRPKGYEIRMLQGRTKTEGRVEVFFRGKWGVICADHWTLLEARVACKEAGLGHAQMAVQSNSFGGDNMSKVFGGIDCVGDEDHLSDCYHHQVGDVVCPEAILIAGVVCVQNLPDLVPNATLLQVSTYLEDRRMLYMQCAMEENCAARSAYHIMHTFRDWHEQRRRLLRFSSSTWNFGTADFRPFEPRESWEWHDCHMHYHSMQVFAVYDLLDDNNNRIAEGHKASFCLEDVQCIPGKPKRYECNGWSDQGISVGCADDYLHDIDCQWIDVTDVKPGRYKFRVHINPEYRVAELDYNNNAATCDLQYTGFTVELTNCALGSGRD